MSGSASIGSGPPRGGRLAAASGSTRTPIAFRTACRRRAGIEAFARGVIEAAAPSRPP